MKNIRSGKGSILSVAFIITLMIFISTSVTFAANSSANNVFTLSENLDVDPGSGIASLSIPLEVPPGRAGIQPNISLLYNSSGSNGICQMLASGFSVQSIS